MGVIARVQQELRRRGKGCCQVSSSKPHGIRVFFLRSSRCKVVRSQVARLQHPDVQDQPK